MNIPLNPVTSSQIKSIGYDAPSKTLAIQFHTGATYHYANVPPELHAEFISAPSQGSFFFKRIKKETALYPFTRQ